MIAALAALGALGAYAWYKHTHTASSRPLGVTSATVKDPVTGLTFKSQFIESFKDDTAKYDVFLMPAGSRVLVYLQTGADKSSRIELISPSGVDASIKAAARRVFGIRPKAS